jgi:hypothetical protein
VSTTAERIRPSCDASTQPRTTRPAINQNHGFRTGLTLMTNTPGDDARGANWINPPLRRYGYRDARCARAELGGIPPALLQPRALNGRRRPPLRSALPAPSGASLMPEEHNPRHRTLRRQPTTSTTADHPPQPSSARYTSVTKRIFEQRGASPINPRRKREEGDSGGARRGTSGVFRGALRRPLATGCTARFQLQDPGLDRPFPEAAVPPEPYVRDPAGSGLGPHPVGVHAEAVGDLAGGQQAIHGDLPSTVDNATCCGQLNVV